jgi:hypothetical protein
MQRDRADGPRVVNARQLRVEVPINCAVAAVDDNYRPPTMSS